MLSRPFFIKLNYIFQSKTGHRLVYIAPLRVLLKESHCSSLYIYKFKEILLNVRGVNMLTILRKTVVSVMFISAMICLHIFFLVSFNTARMLRRSACRTVTDMDDVSLLARSKDCTFNKPVQINDREVSRSSIRNYFVGANKHECLMTGHEPWESWPRRSDKIITTLALLVLFDLRPLWSSMQNFIH